MADVPPFYLYLVLGLIFTGWSLGDLVRYVLVMRWPTVPGRVISVEPRWRTAITESLDGRNALVVYEYQVDGRTYLRTMPYQRGRTSGGYEPGMAVTVYHHPRRPQRSQIELTFRNENYLWFLLGVILLLLVAGVTIFAPNP